MRSLLAVVGSIVLSLLQLTSDAAGEGSGCDGQNDCSWQAEITKAVTRHGCTGVGVDVTASSDTERDLTCAAARDAFELLGRCNIHARTRVSVRVSGKVLHPAKGEVFGFFDGRTATVATLSEASALAAGTPHGLLPNVIFYKSLVVHEIVHAVMNQNYSRQPQTRAAFEYPAYVMQFASLPTTAREKLRSATRSSPIAPGFVFNDILLAMDPFVFAAIAYEHFSAAADGCLYLNALLKGEVDFIPTLPPWL